MKIPLRKRLSLSQDEVYERINAFLTTSVFGINDIKTTKLWRGFYHGVTLDLNFEWQDNRCTWLAITPNDSWQRRSEQVAGFIEVVDLGPDVVVTIGSESGFLESLFHDLARHIYPHAQSPEIFIDNIDSFRQVIGVPPHAVSSKVPLEVLEDDIQNCLENIIGEPFHQKDWGGETADLVTSRLVVDGTRSRAAFLLKGRGTRGKLTIGRCGQNGDQIQKLMTAPADIYIIQHIGEIDQAVVKDLRDKVQLRNRNDDGCKMCIIDGVDTARLLAAYGRLDLEAD